MGIDGMLTARLASALAHRVCCSTEHDPSQGKLHGYCVVCGVPWPCETAQKYIDLPCTTTFGTCDTGVLEMAVKLLNNVKCGYEVYCEDVDGVNWFDLRADFLSKLYKIKDNDHV